MAIKDALLQLSGSYSGSTVTPQDVFSTGSSVVSTNSVDITGGTPLAQIIDIGQGQELSLQVSVITAFAGGTSAEFQIISADDGALTTNVTVLASSGPIAIAALGAGKKVRVALGPEAPRTLRRYIGARVVCVGTVTAGAVMAELTPFTGDRSDQTSHQSGFTVN